uniref:Uncharacterized protein n=1 Tax=Megaselia scalaris TaxID=36166 RepID=T1H5I8_MEGSC
MSFFVGTIFAYSWKASSGAA